MNMIKYELFSRGLIYQYTDEEVFQKLQEEKHTFYIGFDPSADSLHIGHLIPILNMMRLQKKGHKAIAVVGGGTGLVGDPSGKTEMRKLLTMEDIENNLSGIQAVLERFLDKDMTIILNNANWLKELNYIDFLRDFGKDISVNKMLSSESVKNRFESGISFLEFNYMILQAYDFYYLSREYSCDLQMGGQDQWGNIVLGIDLVRRKLNKRSYGITFPLILKSDGEKFGKSEKGAIWLTEDKTPAYELYQYFRNVEDTDLQRFLLLYTNLPIEEIERLSSLEFPLINRTKEILAFEITQLIHGFEKAKEAFIESCRTFGQYDKERVVNTSSRIKDIIIDESSGLQDLIHFDTSKGPAVIDLLEFLMKFSIISSKSEGRRLISQGGIYINDKRIDDAERSISESDFEDGTLIIRKGKKKYFKFTNKIQSV